MGYQKLQVGRATDMTYLLNDLEDTVNLNNPITITADTVLSNTGTLLVTTGATFITDGVRVGDLVVDNGAVASSRVVALVSETTLEIQTAAVFTPTARFSILSQSTEPAVLYVGTAAGGATLKVTTMGGDDVVFTDPIAGTFLPVQVKRVWETGTTASDIIALF